MAEQALDRHYRDLAVGYRVTEDDEFARLVVPNGNGRQPFHRWFHLKEAFSTDLLQTVLSRWRRGVGGDVFLDPFAGVGTGPLCASDGSGTGSPTFTTSFGIEANPFLHFVAETKADAREQGAPGLRELAHEAVRLACSNHIEPGATPGLSSFANSAFFPAEDLRRLLQLRAALELSGAPSVTVAVAKLCLAASLEPVSALRRDGRALRHEPNKTRAQPIDEFLTRVEMATDDVAGRSPVGSASFLRGDGRRPDLSIPDGTRVTVSMFSPPYLNNIDYTEVYKLEAWFLGFYDGQQQFKQQRLRTVRSHPSVRFPDTFGAPSNGHKQEFDDLIAPLLGAIPANRYQVWRGPLFRGYFDDMLETFVALRRLAAPDSLVVYVVGNSLHGSANQHFLVAADLMMARLAELAGFDVVEIVVGRRPSRKRLGGHLLRESVVALTPSHSTDQMMA